MDIHALTCYRFSIQGDVNANECFVSALPKDNFAENGREKMMKEFWYTPLRHPFCVCKC